MPNLPPSRPFPTQSFLTPPAKDPIKEFYAIVTNDVPEGIPPGEAVMAVGLPDGRVVPLITTKRDQAIASWDNLMASEDPAFNDKTYRLIRIHGRRDVLLTQKK
jgi:hypothetical protein